MNFGDPPPFLSFKNVQTQAKTIPCNFGCPPPFLLLKNLQNKTDCLLKKF